MAIELIASAAVSLIKFYFDHLSKKVGDSVASKSISIGEKLWKSIKAKLSSSGNKSAVDDFESNPADKRHQDNIKQIIQEELRNDENWLEEIRNYTIQSSIDMSQTSVDMSQTNIDMSKTNKIRKSGDTIISAENIITTTIGGKPIETKNVSKFEIESPDQLYEIYAKTREGIKQNYRDLSSLVDRGQNIENHQVTGIAKTIIHRIEILNRTIPVLMEFGHEVCFDGTESLEYLQQIYDNCEKKYKKRIAIADEKQKKFEQEQAEKKRIEEARLERERKIQEEREARNWSIGCGIVISIIVIGGIVWAIKAWFF